MIDQAAIRRQIAAGLRRARQRAQRTQAQVAEELALSTSAVRHMEAARHSIRVEQLPAIAAALGYTVRELLVHMRIVRQARERRNPGHQAGASVDGSSMGESSTACGARGDASHHQNTADTLP